MTTVTTIPTKSIDGDQLPWVPFAPYSDDVHLKYHHINPAQGEILVSMRMPGGLRLPTHLHTGIVIGHTLRGAWRYLEHDWVSRAGGTVYETAGSSHTPESVGEEETEIFFLIVGELLFLDEQGNIIARENHITSMERYLAYCREHGLEAVDLTAYH